MEDLHHARAILRKSLPNIQDKQFWGLCIGATRAGANASIILEEARIALTWEAFKATVKRITPDIINVDVHDINGQQQPLSHEAQVITSVLLGVSDFFYIPVSDIRNANHLPMFKICRIMVAILVQEKTSLTVRDFCAFIGQSSAEIDEGIRYLKELVHKDPNFGKLFQRLRDQIRHPTPPAPSLHEPTGLPSEAPTGSTIRLISLSNTHPHSA